MSEHTYRTVDVPVSGGDVRAGVWDPIGAEGPVPTVPAIHGVTSSHLAWQFLVEQLPGVRVIAPDLRGRGASNAIEGPAGMTAHATDMIAVLDAFELEAVPEVGHSMGGFVAVVLAHLHPRGITPRSGTTGARSSSGTSPTTSSPTVSCCARPRAIRRRPRTRST